MHSMHIAYKIWIEFGDKAVFGIGLYQLLMLVRQTGSLHKAAGALKMSYRAAWGKVRQSEELLGFELLEKGRHGRSGAQLTSAADTMINKFQKVLHEMDEMVTEGSLADCVNTIKNIKETA
jgi:molybdate transport system regulatory protein